MTINRQTLLLEGRIGEILTKFYSNRSRLEILSNILSLCVKEKKKTQIMYRANLSYQQLCLYLEFLTSMDLLSVITNNKKTLYKTTVKGLSFLRDFEKIKSTLEKLGPQVE